MRPIRIALAVLSVVLLPSVAWAHAAYKDSDPEDEATISSPPSSVWAEYTEPLQDGSHLEVYDSCGTRVDGSDTSITGYRMEVSMAADMAGTYTVRWVAASAIDPHVTRGAFTFSVSDGDTCAAVAAPADEEDNGADTRHRQNGASATTSDGQTSSGRGSVRAGGNEDRGSGSNDRPRARRQQSSASEEDDAGLIAAQGAEESGSGGIWDGIPWDGFALALAISAAIGAAGGRIYANIMGPRR